MDEVKVSDNIDQSFNDNDSLKNHFGDAEDGPEYITPNTSIDQRDSAPGPPALSQLTLSNMQAFNNQNPPQQTMMNNFIGSGLGVPTTDVPEELIGNLIDMGFDRRKAIYALQQSHQNLQMFDTAFAVQWLFDNPAFVPPEPANMDHINDTISTMLGTEVRYDFMGLQDTLTGPPLPDQHPTDDALAPPNNSPDRTEEALAIDTMPMSIVGVGADRKHHPPLHTAHADGAIYDLMATAANQAEQYSKSGRVYNHSNTMASAATMQSTATVDEEKTVSAVYHASNPLQETKTDDDVLPHPLPSRPHHQATESTVASELSVVSQLSTGNGGNGRNGGNTANAQSSNATKEQISSLYAANAAQAVMTMLNAEAVLNESDLKMVLVVRKDLKMTSGKVAAQCCHACLGVVLDIVSGQHVGGIGHNNGNGGKLTFDLKRVLSVWRTNGEKKIVVQCQSEQELVALKDQAAIHGLPHYLVADAGHTQIKAGSITVLAIGPYLSDQIDVVTKELKLY